MGKADIGYFKPRDWIERVANVVYFSGHDFGGHFPAVSQSKCWVDDTRKFFNLITS